MKNFPFRHSTLSERKEFYEKEFSVSKIKKWFKSNNLPLPQLCALDPGSETKIILDKKLKNNLLYFSFNQLPRKIKQYIPEDVYYDRNIYKDYKKILKTLKFNNYFSQELAFDVDADNIICDHPKNKSVCKKCLNKIYKAALKMKGEINDLGFKKIEIVYSGRGFHVHVMDKKASLLSVKERSSLNKKFKKFPIDPWVSRGYIRLIRMPYSLNSLVSRKTMPIKTKKFSSETGVPKFLKN